MSELQSITALLVLLALAFSPWIYRKAQEKDRNN